MSIGFDPSSTVPLSLDCFDKDKPANERAKFKFRFLTSAQTTKVEALGEEANKAVTNAETDRLLNEAILIGLADWENVKDHDGAAVVFSPAALDEFTVRLKFQIVREYPIKLMLSDAEKKA